MSYCRFSCDDFQCDVYVYEHYLGGFMTHVAKTRYEFAEPLPAVIQFATDNIAAWMARHSKVMDMVKNAKRFPIGLAHDGETFEHATPAECADNLAMLRDMGYCVPQRAIDALREESGQ